MFNIRTKISIIWQHAKYSLCFYAPKQHALTSCTIHPLPHRGCTFDSAGLASATQPTLGNNASEEATPLGVVLFPPHCFLISSHTHIGGGNASRTPAPIT